MGRLGVSIRAGDGCDERGNDEVMLPQNVVPCELAGAFARNGGVVANPEERKSRTGTGPRPL
jgi:hypothetical protein